MNHLNRMRFHALVSVFASSLMTCSGKNDYDWFQEVKTLQSATERWNELKAGLREGRQTSLLEQWLMLEDPAVENRRKALLYFKAQHPRFSDWDLPYAVLTEDPDPSLRAEAADSFHALWGPAGLDKLFGAYLACIFSPSRKDCDIETRALVKHPRDTMQILLRTPHPTRDDFSCHLLLSLGLDVLEASPDLMKDEPTRMWLQAFLPDGGGARCTELAQRMLPRILQSSSH